MSRYRASAASVLLGAALAAVSFGAASGDELGRTTTTEIAMLAAGAVAVALGVLYIDADRPRRGTLTLGAFAALAVITSTSVLWSVTPDISFVEGARTLSYLAVFAGAIAAGRLAPRGASVLLPAVLIAVAIVCAYALGSRIFPDTIGGDAVSNRIGSPYGYWNALGVTAAMAMPGTLWLGSRRYGQPVLNALAYPLMGLVMVTIMLTQSRSAVAAAALGAVLWFAAVPLRLRSLPVLVAGAVVSAPVIAWSLSKDAFTKGFQTPETLQSISGEFGMLVLLTLVILLGVGLAVNLGHRRIAPPRRFRRRAGAAALAVALLIPLVGLTSVAFSDRGLGGAISHQAKQLTQETDATPTGAARLTSSSSSRSQYWRQAIKVFKQKPTLGTGAGSFEVSSLHFHRGTRVTRHAHGYVVQTMSDLGLLGLGAIVLLALAWLTAAGRATGLGPRVTPALSERLEKVVRLKVSPRRDWDAERVMIVALALTAVVFGAQSTIDWTWFFPGCAVLMLVAAGFVASLGAVGSTPGQVATAGGPAAAAEPGPARLSLPPFPGWGRTLGAVAILVTAGLAAWSSYQPQHSARLVDHAQDQAAGHDIKGALATLERAHDANPLSPEPILVRGATLTGVGRIGEARRSYERAVRRNPGDPRTWQALANFELVYAKNPTAALTAARGVLYLDPSSHEGAATFLSASHKIAVAEAQQKQLLASRAAAPVKAKPKAKAKAGAKAKPAPKPKPKPRSAGGGATAPTAKGARK